MHRDYVGIDLQPDYVKMANKWLAEAKSQYALLEQGKAIRRKERVCDELLERE